VTATLVLDSAPGADRPAPDTPPETTGERRLERLLLGTAIALGILVRVLPVLAFDFPLNDGGLFYQMALELQRAGYAIPDITSYNGDGIPFAYAPLGFYVAALLGQTPQGILAAVRWIPPIVTVLGLPAFVLLARRLLPNERTVIAATFAFALLPRAYIWLIMGGGLTRSFGILFTLVALWQAHLLYTTRAWRHVLPTAAFTSLTVLSHIGTAPFLAASIALMWVAFGRHRQGILASLVVAALTIALTAPWWGVVVAEHGLAPFRAAQETGGSVLSSSEARWSIRLALSRLTLGITGEPLFPIILVTGMLGALVEITRRRWVLPAWWLLIVLAELRAPGTYSAIPIAMLAGVAVTEALVPLLRHWQGRAAGARPRTFRLAGAAVSRWTAGVLTAMVAYATFALSLRSPSVTSEFPFLTSLGGEDRAAMRWMATSTPTQSRVLVVTGAAWANDRIAEWFPVLAQRRSVATVQGSEWLPGGEFARRYDAYESLAECASRDVACVEQWASSRGKPFTHLYVAKTMGKKGMPGTDCCTALIASAQSDPRYRRIYDGPGAAIFEPR
jgi:hypothetical protein